MAGNGPTSGKNCCKESGREGEELHLRHFSLGSASSAERAWGQPQLGASLSRKRRCLPNAFLNGIDCCHCFGSFLNPCLGCSLCSRRVVVRNVCSSLWSGVCLTKAHSHIGFTSDDYVDISVSLDQSGSNAPNQASHQAQHSPLSSLHPLWLKRNCSASG